MRIKALSKCSDSFLCLVFIAKEMSEIYNTVFKVLLIKHIKATSDRGARTSEGNNRVEGKKMLHAFIVG
jgi:hypothetical protein